MPKKIDPKVAEKLMLKAGLKPLEPYKKSSSKWKCIHIQCGRLVYPRYSDIKKSDGTLRSGCIQCGYLKTKIPEKDAIATMRKIGFTPLEKYKSADSPWKCKCNKCGSIVTPKFSAVKQGKNCKVCSRRRTLVDPRKLASIMKKRRLKPLEPYINNKTRWKCECLRCGKIVYPTFASIQNLDKNSTGCMDCGRKQLYKSNTTPEKIAVAVMLKSQLKPLEPFKNSASRWKCKCLVCKQVVVTSYTSVAYHKTGCRYCTNLQKEIENKRKDSLALAKKAGLMPLEPYKSVHAPWKCKCLICQKIVFPSLNGLQNGGGCKYCAVRGINLNVPSYIYLITNNKFYSHKVGIGNKKTNYTDRLTQFNKKGWETYKVWNFETGEEAWRIEQAIFRVIRKDLKIPSHLSLEQMGKRLGGHSETIDADSITLLELEKIIKNVIKGHKK